MWTEFVQIGDYVKVLFVKGNYLSERVLPVTKVTKKSIYVGNMQFSKANGNQTNNKRVIHPFMAHHI